MQKINCIMQNSFILMLPNFDSSLNMDNDSSLERRLCRELGRSFPQIEHAREENKKN